MAWRFAAASVTGSAHLTANLPCQDRSACRLLDDGTLIAVVADGAGSATYAEVGAEIAVATSIDIIQGTSGDAMKRLAAAGEAAREAVLARATAENKPAREFASTLLAVIAAPEEDEKGGAAALQIGDGVIVVGDGHGEWSWVFWPQHGEYVNTTHFLTDEDALQNLQMEQLERRIRDVAVLSDGLEPLALDLGTQVASAGFFTPMVLPLVARDETGEIGELSAALSNFLMSPRVTDRASDDLTAILATRRDVPVVDPCS